MTPCGTRVAHQEGWCDCPPALTMPATEDGVYHIHLDEDDERLGHKHEYLYELGRTEEVEGHSHALCVPDPTWGWPKTTAVSRMP